MRRSPNPHLVVRLRVEECEARITPAGPGFSLFAPGIIGGPHGAAIAEMHWPGDGFSTAASHGWKESGETASIVLKGITEDGVLFQIIVEPVAVYVSLTSPPGHNRDVNPSAVGLDTPSAGETVPAGVTPNTSGVTQVVTTRVTPATIDTHPAVQSGSAGKSDIGVASDFHGVEVGAGISAGDASAALNSVAHLQSPGLPSVGWLTAAYASSWLATGDAVIPASASGQAGASNHPRAEATAAGLSAATSAVGVDPSDPLATPAPNGMADEPQDGTAPKGTSPMGNPGTTEESPTGPAAPGVPDAMGTEPSGEVRADSGAAQIVTSPAESGGDVTGVVDGAVGQLFGWVTDLSSLSAGNELGVYLALVALGATAAGAEVRRRKQRAESKNYTEAAQQPRLAVLNMPT